jgi:hypothetical protein
MATRLARRNRDHITGRQTHIAIEGESCTTDAVARWRPARWRDAALLVCQCFR